MEQPAGEGAELEVRRQGGGGGTGGEGGRVRLGLAELRSVNRYKKTRCSKQGVEKRKSSKRCLYFFFSSFAIIAFVVLVALVTWHTHSLLLR